MCHRTSPIARDRVVNDRQPPLEMVQLRHELETYTQPHILYQMKGSWVHRFGSIKWRRNRKHGAVRFSFSATRSRVRFDGEVREDSVRNHLIENQDFGAQGCWDATRLCPPLVIRGCFAFVGTHTYDLYECLQVLFKYATLGMWGTFQVFNQAKRNLIVLLRNS